eukprot:11078212-Lingulodinium_polyedra.AAC.1
MPLDIRERSAPAGARGCCRRHATRCGNRVRRLVVLPPHGNPTRPARQTCSRAELVVQDPVQ